MIHYNLKISFFIFILINSNNNNKKFLVSKLLNYVYFCYFYVTILTKKSCNSHSIFSPIGTTHIFKRIYPFHNLSFIVFLCINPTTLISIYLILLLFLGKRMDEDFIVITPKPIHQLECHNLFFPK